MTGGDPDPLIVTLEADPASQARFDAARARWFPPERNLVPAHVTLFHRLPGERADAVMLRLSQVAEQTAPPAFRVARVMALGRGAALRLDLALGRRAAAGDRRGVRRRRAGPRGAARARHGAEQGVPRGGRGDARDASRRLRAVERARRRAAALALPRRAVGGGGAFRVRGRG